MTFHKYQGLLYVASYVGILVFASLRATNIRVLITASEKFSHFYILRRYIGYGYFYIFVTSYEILYNQEWVIFATPSEKEELIMIDYIL